MSVKRICWDCKDAPVQEWTVVSKTDSSDGCLFKICCPECKKEARVYGWMIGCNCDNCKSHMIGAGK
ncbi:MAG: hypothetical protein V3U74_07900 [Thermodesulfobacteriota bacterium]